MSTPPMLHTGAWSTLPFLVNSCNANVFMMHWVMQLSSVTVLKDLKWPRSWTQRYSKQCSRIRIFRIFSDFKKTWLFTFFGNDVSKKNVKVINTYQVCWMSIEILGSKLPNVIGTYRHLSHTVLSCIVSCVHTSEQEIDVGDRGLQVPTSGNWVIKGCMTKCRVSGYVFTFF